jgi:hypothetical protein
VKPVESLRFISAVIKVVLEGGFNASLVDTAAIVAALDFPLTNYLLFWLLFTSVAAVIQL